MGGVVQGAPGQRQEPAAEGEEAEGPEHPDGGREEAGAAVQRPGEAATGDWVEVEGDDPRRPDRRSPSLSLSPPGGEGKRAAEAAQTPAGGGGGGGAAHGGGPAEAAEGAGGGERGQRHAEPRGGVAQEQTQVGGRRRGGA